MSRETYVWRDGRMVSKDEAVPLEGSPFIVRDQMDPTWHPANGQHYDSKSTFRRVTKDAGCIEVGNEPLIGRTAGPPKLDGRQRVDDIRRSIYELKNGRRHGS